VGRLVRVPLTAGAGQAKPAAGHVKANTGQATAGTGAGKPGAGQGKSGHGRSGAAAGGAAQGRVVAADAGGVTLEINGEQRRFGYAALGAGVVQIEFDRPGDAPGTGTSAEDRGPESRGPGAEPDGH